MDLNECPHARRPANLSWLSDYVLGALACSDMELNCAAGIWWRGDCCASLEPQSGWRDTVMPPFCHFKTAQGC